MVAMTYHPGMRLASFGGPNQDPHLTCDGCGVRYNIPADRMPPKWLMENKAPKGWRYETKVDPKTQEQRTKHYCPRCK